MGRRRIIDPLIVYRKFKRYKSVSKIADMFGLKKSSVYSILNDGFSILGSRIADAGGFNISDTACLITIGVDISDLVSLTNYCSLGLPLN